jgi:LmbE family N-acetylglucosaminyl deacetylase
MTTTFYVPESAMAIVAHPDDIEFSCAGTMARWKQLGSRISYVLCTSGDVGIATPGMTREKAMEIREKEAREAARIAGADEIIFLREPDGLLQATLDLRKKLVREIRRFKPEVVITGDPTLLFADDAYINHPDHRAAATAALDAVFPASGQPNLFQELEKENLRSHKVRKVFISGRHQNEMIVDISETMEIKLQALRAHISQFPAWDPGEMVKEWAAETGKEKGMQYAEAFRVISIESDENWEKLRQLQNQAGD